MSTQRLYRPTGARELELVLGLDARGWPPRRADQPIFYPVLNAGYALQIARDWNARKNDDRVGYVTEFDVDRDFAARYPAQVVGSRDHAELWVPADELELFNGHIRGRIRVTSAVYGAGFATASDLGRRCAPVLEAIVSATTEGELRAILKAERVQVIQGFMHWMLTVDASSAPALSALARVWHDVSEDILPTAGELLDA